MQSGQSLVNGPVGRTMSVLCFDENTKVQTFEGQKAIKDVKIGERLQGNLAMVTSVYKIDGTGVQMYSLSDIVVSGSHKVKHKEKFIRVDQHPSAKKLDTPSKTLVCLNTSNHRISIKNYEFLDFVESEDVEFTKFKNTYIQMLYNGKVSKVSTDYTTGIVYGTRISTKNGPMMVQNIEINDVLENGDTVKGICCHLLKSDTCVEVVQGVLVSPGTWIYKNNEIILAESIGNHCLSESKNMPVFQLITESSMYTVLGKDSRLTLLDELQTTEPFFHSMKDSIITSGRFRNKLVVV
jgi:hypothetical protein